MKGHTSKTLVPTLDNAYMTSDYLVDRLNEETGVPKPLPILRYNGRLLKSNDSAADLPYNSTIYAAARFGSGGYYGLDGNAKQKWHIKFLQATAKDDGVNNLREHCCG